MRSFCFCFVVTAGALILALRSGVTLSVHGGPYGIEPELIKCKGNTLPAVWSLLPWVIQFFDSFSLVWYPQITFFGKIFCCIYIYLYLVYTFTYWKVYSFIHILAIVNNTVLNMGLQTSQIFCFYWISTWTRIVCSYSYILKFLRNLHTCFDNRPVFNKQYIRLISLSSILSITYFSLGNMVVIFSYL